MRLINLIKWGMRRVVCLAFLTATASGVVQNATAQNTITLNSASFSQLQSDVAYTNLTATQTVVCAFNGTINFTSPLFIGGNILLIAPSNYSVTLNGGGTRRLFQVLTNVTFTLSNLTLSGGASIGTNGVNGGAGINGTKGGTGTNGSVAGNGFGGALYNLGNTYVYNCTFLTNKAIGGNGGNGGTGGNGTITAGGNGGIGGNGGFGIGGAIYNLGKLVVSNTSLLGNFSTGGNGGTGGTNGSGGSAYPGQGGTGAAGSGGAIYNLGTASIYASTFAANFCTAGNSQTAGGTPGGNGTGPTGPAGASSLGGGLYNSGSNILVNCTFSDNQVAGGAGGNGGEALYSYLKAGAGGNGGNGMGGGLYNETGGNAFVTNCTFADGVVFGGTNGFANSFGTFNNNGNPGGAYGANIANNGILTLRATILAYPTNAYSYYGTGVDGGYNISSDPTPTFAAVTSQNNLDPLLDSLTTNGGPTLTFYPEYPVSPVLDAIPNLPGNYPAVDQRGYIRPLGGAGDIGAVEYGTPTYILSGQITPTNNSYTNITILATGTGSSFSASPDVNGFYSFANLPADTYAVVPQITNGYIFSPTSTNVTLSTTVTAATNVNFAATVTYRIGGYITNLNTSVSVFIYLTSNGTNSFYSSVASDTNSYYTFTNIPQGNYLIVPQNTATNSYSPGSVQYAVSGQNTNINFSAIPPIYVVSGSISGAPGVVTIQASLGSGGSLFGTFQSDASGNYSFSLPANTYTIKPLPTNGYTFSPSAPTVTLPPGTNGLNFTAVAPATYSISGQVQNYSTALSLSADSSGNHYTTSSDSGGNYTFSSVANGSYTITPGSILGATVLPATQSATVSSASVSGKNFTVYANTNSLNARPKYSNGFFNFNITNAVPFLSYRIQSSTNLLTSNWVTIATNTIGANGSSAFSIPVSGTTNRFFRSVTP